MRTLITLALLVAVASPAVQAANDSKNCRIGQVSRVFGEVKVIRDGATVAPVAGESICIKDRFVTNSRGIAELKFRDGSEITVAKDSVFVIDRWKERRFFANEASFELVSGAFRALTGAITQRRHTFEIKTTVATIGVRGTEFWGGMNLSPDALDVIMLNGKGVYVKNAAGQVEISRPGTGVTARANGKPSEPAAWEPEKVKRAVSTITP